MLDFIADNYLWFIVLGAVLLAIALILLFTRKKPIKEEEHSTQTSTANDALTPEIVEVTGDTEILDIVEENVEPSIEPTLEVLEPTEETKNEDAKEMDPFAFEIQSSESAVDMKNEQLLEETITEPLVINEIAEPTSEASEMSVTEEITFDEPVIEPVEEEIIAEPVVLDNDVLTEENLTIEENTVTPINVGDVVMPEESVNTDNVQVNNEQEDIWKF